MRIRAEREFAAVYRTGRRVKLGPMVVILQPNRLGHPRLGISAPRRLGGAVVRNRVKRMIREAFRLSQHELGAMDIVCVPRSVPESVDQVARILKDAAARFEK